VFGTGVTYLPLQLHRRQIPASFPPRFTAPFLFFSGKIIKEGMTQNVLHVLGHQSNISPTLGRIDHMSEWQATVILQIG